MNFPDPGIDSLQPFRLGRQRLRGQHVRLGETARTILGQTDYPAPVATLLGELLALTVLLGGSLKYQGVFTAQARGEGPVHTLVADLTSEGALRGYASFDRAAVMASEAEVGRDPVPRLLGAGHLAFTVDQGPDTERYQGIVELEGASLSECAHTYFRQSEQIATVITLAAAPVAGSWRAGALMLQRVPGEGGLEADATPDDMGAGLDLTDTDPEEDWRRGVILMSSVRPDELLDPALGSERLLFRLFHAEGVRLHRPRTLHFACRCSRERVTSVLRSLPRAEVESMRIDGLVVVTCQFCHRAETFDDLALDRLYAA
ncbi:MAG: molecular chaperone Hsp33 [Alphaproteobacteria bacterium]|nr:molecular chaperone Hsp33 [Alphaproteobacteria bacterium]